MLDMCIISEYSLHVNVSQETISPNELIRITVLSSRFQNLIWPCFWKNTREKLDNEENKGGTVNSADILFDNFRAYAGSLTTGTITNFTKQIIKIQLVLSDVSFRHICRSWSYLKQVLGILVLYRLTFLFDRPK
jgi:hypothetical protein